MILTKHIKKRFFLSAILLLAGFLVSSEALAAGMSVGNNTLNLGAGENIYYGVTSATNTNGNFLLLEKGYGNTVFKIDYNGNITTNGNLTGANSYWTGSGNNLFAATTYNVGIGTANAGAYKLNVNGNTNITGTLNVTGALTTGGITGLTIAAPNVSSGAFAANTGGGNFSFPGSLGIGTTGPNYKLDVVGSMNASHVLVQGTPDTTSGAIVYLRDSQATAVGTYFGGISFFSSPGTDYTIGKLSENGNSFLAFKNADNGSEYMRLTSSGNFGIGTTDPGAYKLYVNGNTNINGTLTATGITGVTVNAANVSAGAFAANTGGGDFSFTGNLGIGTATPYGKLDTFLSGNGVRFMTKYLGAPDYGPALYMSNDVGSTQKATRIRSTYSGVGTASWANFAIDRSTDSQAYGGDPSLLTYTNSFTIDGSNGNVGIGTTNPGAYRLYVNGNTNINGTLNATAYTGGSMTGTVSAANVSAGSFAANTGGGNFTFPGSLGIGTASPGYKLDILGDAINSRFKSSSPSSYSETHWDNDAGVSTVVGSIGSTYSNGNWSSSGYIYTAQPHLYIKNVSSGGDISFFTGGESNPGNLRMNINSSGNVNIGSTLTVNGGANIVGNLVMSGTANITGINKISVNTVDPLYNIHGTNYASFAASVVGGVKEEVTGKVAIEDKVGSEYQTVINFDKQTIGSDLWVWRNVIDFNKDNVEALITPYGSFANTYYYISGNSIIFKSDRPTEISYRLIAKRFDWKKWPTLPADQTEKAGLIIK
jgi:hypothetical protein